VDRATGLVAEYHFDVSASLPAGSTKGQVAKMWRNLLASKFHLTAHRESKEAADFDLVVAKGGPKLLPVGANEPRPSAPFSSGTHNMNGKMNMDGLAGFLEAQLQRPVNNNGVDGDYHVVPHWTDDMAPQSRTVFRRCRMRFRKSSD
jgi:uncharacterized protein (TIGR03435 family)